MDFGWTYSFLGKPVVWKRAGRAKNRYFDTQIKEKNEYRKQLRDYHKGDLFKDPMYAEMIFAFPMPASWSDKKKAEMDGKAHFHRPDLDNLQKFICDCLVGVVIHDDCIISSIFAKKYWTYEPGFTVISLNPKRN